jgi:hypothetical protein
MNTSTDFPHPLDGAFERVDRAHQHFREFVQQTEAVRQEQANLIVINFDPEPPHEPIPEIVRTATVPLSLGVLVGEVCYNLRAALDYLVSELALLDSGQIQKGSQFPIENRRKDFEGNGQRRLAGLNARHIAAIEVLQPYNGCDWTRTLRDISNPDKHRSLVLTQGEFRLSVYPDADRLRFLPIPGTIARALHPTTGKEVDVKLDLALSITFEDGTPVIETLEEIQSQVAAQLAKLKPEFM